MGSSVVCFVTVAYGNYVEFSILLFVYMYLLQYASKKYPHFPQLFNPSVLGELGNI